MKQHKYQLIRVHVPEPGASVRFTGETDRSYGRLAGIFVAMPEPIKEIGAALGLKIGGQEIFDDEHDVRLLTCGREVAPNDKFYQFPEHIEAGGASIEGRLVDAANSDQGYPFEARIILHLVSEK
jgi:hypothetical protein|tara:strand:+ start:15744 stop:16118 length:375 start_codon:yes stop_codon:yes gene_type:complete